MKKLLLLVLTTLLLGLAVPALASSKDVSFARSSVTVAEGGTVQLTLNKQGSFANGKVTYKSSNTRIATVSSAGLVTGIKKGSVTITATVTAGKRTMRATCKVTVQRQATGITVKTEKWLLYNADDDAVLDLEPEDNTLPVLVMVPGARLSVSATVTPKDASSLKYTVRSSDASVLKVSGSTVTAQSVGTCVMTVASSITSSVNRQYLVTVITPISSLSISGESTIFVGSTTGLEVRYSPATAGLQMVTWTSSSPRIATVDENGIVTGISRGSVTITAKAADGSGASRTFKVTVSVAPTSLSILQNHKEVGSINLAVNAKTTLTASVKPSTVSNRSVKWYSDDTSVAVVNSKGQVTGISVGTCTITAESSLMEDVRESVTVTVVQPVTRIVPSESVLELDSGESETVYWTVYPGNATIQTLTFTTSNRNVATVDEFGTIYAVGGGTCNITAKATDGSGKTGRVSVTVIQPVEGVHMKNDSYSVGVDESATLTAVLEPTSATDHTMTWYVEDSQIAEISGEDLKPVVTGMQWGDTVVYGITNDGGFTTSCELHVGDYNKALEVTDLYILDNDIRIAVQNVSNLTIARFTFQVEVYDIYDNPVICSTDGGNVFHGFYNYRLKAGATTKHGQFSFGDYNYPNAVIGRVVLTITGYSESDGTSHTIREAYQVPVSYTSSQWVGPITTTPEPEATATPEPTLIPENDEDTGDSQSTVGEG